MKARKLTKGQAKRGLPSQTIAGTTMRVGGRQPTRKKWRTRGPVSPVTVRRA